MSFLFRFFSFFGSSILSLFLSCSSSGIILFIYQLFHYVLVFQLQILLYLVHNITQPVFLIWVQSVHAFNEIDERIFRFFEESDGNEIFKKSLAIVEIGVVLEFLLGSLRVNKNRRVKKFTKSTKIHRYLIIQSHQLRWSIKIGGVYAFIQYLDVSLHQLPIYVHCIFIESVIKIVSDIIILRFAVGRLVEVEFIEWVLEYVLWLYYVDWRRHLYSYNIQKYISQGWQNNKHALIFIIQSHPSHAYNQGIISPNRVAEQKRRNPLASRGNLLVEVQRQSRRLQGIVCSCQFAQPKCSCNRMQLLTSLQRIPAIFLLIENYKTEGISHHPFGATILEIVQCTPEPFEKRMISDMIIDSQRQQYSRIKVELLYEREQAMIDPIDDRAQIKHIKQQFLMNLPQISQQSQSEVKNVVRDFIDKERQTQIPDFHVSLGTIKQAEINEESFNVGFMRPIPKFIDVDPSEFHWFSPSISPQIMWDSTSETNKKLSKGKSLFKKAMDQHLTKDECLQIQKTLQSDPNSALYMDITTQMLPALIKQNPFLAVAYLVKLSSFPIIQTYLQVLLSCEVSVNSIDVASKLFKTVKVSNEFVVKYTNSILTKVLEMDDSNKEQAKLARVVISFIKNFKKTKLNGCEEFQEKLDRFLDEFIAVEEVQQFRKLMNKQ